MTPGKRADGAYTQGHGDRSTGDVQRRSVGIWRAQRKMLPSDRHGCCRDDVEWGQMRDAYIVGTGTAKACIAAAF